MSLRFQWDSQKEKTDLKKHGVSFAEAATVFGDPLAGIKNDPEHSENEKRYVIIGISQKFRVLIIVFTERNDIIRIINARRAIKKERFQYENKFKTKR